jgi:hypothetical protein
MIKSKVKQALLFLKKKKQKNFWNFGPWAVAASQPMVPSHKSFLLLFFKKEALA